MVESRREKVLFILDLIGCIVAIIALWLLMFTMTKIENFYIVFVTILLIYVVFQLADFLGSVLSYVKKPKIKKYSGSKVSIIKYKYLIW